MKTPDRADEFNMRQITRTKATKTSRRIAPARPDLHNIFNEVMIAEITEDRCSGRRDCP